MIRRTVLLFLLLAAVLAPSAAPAQDDLRRTPVVRAVEAVSPAVVNIVASRMEMVTPLPFGGAVRGPALERFMREFGIAPVERKANNLGSGVIVDSRRGFVITNAHVISGASEIAVRLKDGRELKADLVAAEPDFDIAVLKLETAQGLPQVEMGDSSDLMIGEPVIAIGNPFGFTHTVTTGVVSAVNRTVETGEETYTDFIQTDAAINPGNSGGPLLNIYGRLVGINTAVHAQAENIGFAIPVNRAKRVMEELISQGRVAPVWLGLFGQDVDQAAASYLGLKKARGMLVTDLHRGGPAERAGVRRGDVVVELDGKALEDRSHFVSQVRNHSRGDEVELGILRGGSQLKIEVEAQAMDDAAAQALAMEHWGFKTGQAGKNGGIVIAELAANGPAARLGLKRGDVLHQIGNQVLEKASDLTRAFARYHMHNMLLLRVQRGNAIGFVKMPV